MDDGATIRAAQAGKREAFGALVERHQEVICRLCYRVAGNVPDAEELAHEAFVEAFLKLSQLREPASFLPWLKALALNVCRMWYRRTRRRAAEPIEEATLAAAEPEADAGVSARMAAGLSMLSTPHRLVLALHYWEGLPYDEVARFLDVPVGTVMSRLHRARHALKEHMEEMAEAEEVPMTPDGSFKQEVDAEIGVLLAMFRKEPSAAERLSVILARSPERFARLLEEADEGVLGNLAALLPRLGSKAIAIAVERCFSSDPPAAARAGEVLKGAMVRCKSPNVGGWDAAAASEAYPLLDAVIRFPADGRAKAEFLLETMEACEDVRVVVLLTNVLLCYPDAAFPLLLGRFWSFASVGDLYGSAAILHALCRTGTRFCQVLLGPLESCDAREQALAVAGVEALARCLYQDWLQDATPLHFAHEVRERLNWPPLRSKDMDPTVLRAMTGAVAALLDNPRAEIRETAIRALGHLPARPHLDRLRGCLGHEDASTRLAAILALADMGDTESAELLMRAARDGGPAERHAAIEAVGRLKVRDARPLLRALLDDPDTQVRVAAVIAIGEVAGEEARGLLQELLRSRDRQVQRAAAKGLYGKKAHRPETAAPPRPPLRPYGETHPFTWRSLGAAIRYALPEIRSFDVRDLTRRIAQVCSDYSAVRRDLIERGFMTRDDGTYEFTELGEAVWRVEHFIMERYLVAEGQPGSPG